MSRLRTVEDHYTGKVEQLDLACAPEGDELDESSDPFEILARKEERAGVPLIHMVVDYDD